MSRIAGYQITYKDMYEWTQDVLLNIFYHYQRCNHQGYPKVYISGEYFDGCKKYAEEECMAELSEDNTKLTFCNGIFVYLDDSLLGPQLRIEQ